MMLKVFVILEFCSNIIFVLVSTSYIVLKLKDRFYKDKIDLYIHPMYLNEVGNSSFVVFNKHEIDVWFRVEEVTVGEERKLVKIFDNKETCLCLGKFSILNQKRPKLIQLEKGTFEKHQKAFDIVVKGTTSGLVPKKQIIVYKTLP